MIFSNIGIPGKWITWVVLSLFLLTSCAILSPRNTGGQTPSPTTTSVQPGGSSDQKVVPPTIVHTETLDVPTTTLNVPKSTQVTTSTPLPTVTTMEVVNTPSAQPTPPLPTQPDMPTLAVAKVGVPSFDHIFIIMFENRDFNEVIGNPNLPNFNRLATENVLFTRYYAVAHPSLPDYLALIGGNTFGITNDCGGCFVNSTSLPDLIEASGRTWKTYQEDMPAPCFHGSSGKYAQNHNPFMYFDPIRTNATRCEQSVVPLSELTVDLNSNTLPNYAFIVPNVCNSAHSCGVGVADDWVNQMVNQLQSSPAFEQNSMIFILFDESSSDNTSCCGLPAKAGGRIAAILISPLARNGFQDDTPLSHYGLLKTILLSWNLPGLGNTENPATTAITAPWK